MPTLLHPDAAADRLGVTTRTLRRMLTRGELPRINIGSPDRPRYRVSEEALTAFIDQRTTISKP